MSLPLRHCILTLLLCWLLLPLQGQVSPANGQVVGFYISGSQFDYNEFYHMHFARYLVIDEDRSFGASEKAEFLIRLGEQLSAEMKRVSGADSVVFLNAHPDLGRSFMAAYDGETGSLSKLHKDFGEIDQYWVLSSLALDTRISKSVFIRSNRMITERVRHMYAHLQMRRYSSEEVQPMQELRVCLDEREMPKVSQEILLKGEGRLGRYMSRLCSLAWLSIAQGDEGNCQEPK